MSLNYKTFHCPGELVYSKVIPRHLALHDLFISVSALQKDKTSLMIYLNMLNWRLGNKNKIKLHPLILKFKKNKLPLKTYPSNDCWHYNTEKNGHIILDLLLLYSFLSYIFSSRRPTSFLPVAKYPKILA